MFSNRYEPSARLAPNNTGKVVEFVPLLVLKFSHVYALKATITGNTITLEPLTTSLSGTDITASGTLETNNLITLNTTITNSGTALFNNYLYLFVDGVLAGGKMFEVEGKEIANFSIEYTPISPGEKNLTICTDNQGKEVIATGRVTISGSDVITDNIDLDVTYDLINRSGDKIMGNYLQVVANYANNQDVNYSGTVYIYLHRKYSDGVYIYTGWSNVYREFSVPANSTAKFEYTFTDLDYDKTYNVEVKYIKAGSEVTGAGMLDNYRIMEIRVLPSNVATFPTIESFEHFVKATMVARGGLYYFLGSMMQCTQNTLVLFQYQNAIRAVGILIEAKRQSIIDENGVQRAGYYKFLLPTLQYLNEPITKKELTSIVPEFPGFNQTKHRISMDYLNEIVSLIDSRIESLATEKIEDFSIPLTGDEKEVSGCNAAFPRR